KGRFSKANRSEWKSRYDLILLSCTLDPLGPLCDGAWSTWTPFQLNCYKLYNEKKTWEEAKQHCEAQKAHLIVINSDAEQCYYDIVRLTVSVCYCVCDSVSVLLLSVCYCCQCVIVCVTVSVCYCACGSVIMLLCV
uniref:C-type lectin domain-containing protein n=1 Tax=Leptobrachium leishanense TaxID=445787 RepID=A0A8C5LWR8_9ANUR